MRNSFVTSISVLAVYATTAVAQSASPFVIGKVDVAPQVTRLGSLGLNVPVWTPPGIGELGPALALAYDSNAGDSPFGLGWSLTGMSAIARCDANLAAHGERRGVTRTRVDRLCLDGNELTLVAGQYGAPGSTYGTKLETFSRIVASTDSRGDAPLAFTVTAKDGFTFVYGGVQGAVPTDGAPLSWRLTSVRDRAGNQMRVHYALGAETRLTHIDYPVVVGTDTPLYQVVFDYEARPDRQGAFHAGVASQVDHRVGAIRVVQGADGRLIRALRLGYEQSAVSNRSLLTSLQLCWPGTVTSGFVERCVPPSRLEYGTASVQPSAQPMGAPAYLGAGMQLPGDYNGDGWSDLLWCATQTSDDSACGWSIRWGGANGFVQDTPIPAPLGRHADTRWPAIVANLTGQGRQQALLAFVDDLEAADYFVLDAVAPGGASLRAANATFGKSAEAHAADVDGDHLPDLIYTDETRDHVFVRRNATLPGGAIAWGQPQLIFQTSQYFTIASGMHTSLDERGTGGVDIGDFNGDGRADVAVTETQEVFQEGFAPPLACWLGDCAATTRLLLASGPPSALRFDVFHTTAGNRAGWGFRVLDWNGDGCADYWLGANTEAFASVYTSDCQRAFVETTVDVWVPYPAFSQPLVFDYNGDGRDDILINQDVTTDAFGDFFDTALMWDVGGFRAQSLTARIGVASTDGAYRAMVMDANGDGRSDIAFQLAHAQTAAAALPLVYAFGGVVQDRASAIVDGFGNRTSVRYRALPGANYEARTDATHPLVDAVLPFAVVDQIGFPDGLGGQATTAYEYAGLRTDLSGQVAPSFARVGQRDGATGRLDVTDYAQAFPFTGMAIRNATFIGTQLNSETTHTLTATTVGSEPRHYPFVASSHTWDFALAAPGETAGRLLRSIVVDRVIDAATGNMLEQTQTIVNHDSETSLAGERHVARTVVAYDVPANAAVDASWCFGLPTLVTTTHQADGLPNVVEQVAYVNDRAACRVSQVVREPSSALSTTTLFGYDSCGNQTSSVMLGRAANGEALPPRQQVVDYGPRCQAPIAVTDASGATTRFTYDWDVVLPSESVDPNGLVTTKTYDVLGRLVAERLPNQTTQRWSVRLGDAGFHHAERTETLDSTGVVAVWSETRVDALSRPVAVVRAHPTMGEVLTETIAYNALGQIIERTTPSVSGGPATTRSVTYDALGRVVQASTQGGGSESPIVLRTEYRGNTTLAADPTGRVTATVVDALGRLRRGTEPSGATTRTDYDAAGRPRRVEGPDGLASLTHYNDRGNIVSQTDPNMGTYTFSSNSFGEVEQVVTSTGRVIAQRFDVMGRRIARSDDGWQTTQQWTYGSDAAAHNVHQLALVAGADGYAESYQYDVAGRLAAQELTIDGQAFRTDRQYNAAGALARLRFPETSSGQRVDIAYQYEQGKLVGIATADGQPLWRAIAENEHRSVVAEHALGVTVTTTRQPWNNLPTSLRAEVANGTAVLDVRTAWDATGLLRARQDLLAGEVEAFDYDNQHRLVSVTRGGVPVVALSYAANGNILSRSDVGAYLYEDPLHPHAVTQAGAGSFAYDAAGNMRVRNGVEQRWSSTNMPLLVANQATWSTFAYAPSDARIKQVASDGSVTYYAGAMEKHIDAAGAISWTHTIKTPGQAQLIARVTAAAPTLVAWDAVVTDHLGSGLLRAAADGSIHQQRYGAFGEPRVSADSSNRLGFTGQESLAALGVVHLNGRVYDPSLGRFLSADPVLGGTPQSQNAYSYVNNQPLSATDPTGFSSEPIVEYQGMTGYWDNGQFVQQIVITATRPPADTTGLAAGGLFGAGSWQDNGFECNFGVPVPRNGPWIGPLSPARDFSSTISRLKALMGPFVLLTQFSPAGRGRGMLPVGADRIAAQMRVGVRTPPPTEIFQPGSYMNAFRIGPTVYKYARDSIADEYPLTQAERIETTYLTAKFSNALSDAIGGNLIPKVTVLGPGRLSQPYAGEGFEYKNLSAEAKKAATASMDDLVLRWKSTVEGMDVPPGWTLRPDRTEGNARYDATGKNVLQWFDPVWLMPPRY